MFFRVVLSTDLLLVGWDFLPKHRPVTIRYCYHPSRSATALERLDTKGLVFTTDTGGPINPSNLRQRSFAPLLKQAGLPHMRFHDLRQTCATLLLSRGVHPKFVQELLGHATIAITLDTYSHVMPSMGDATAKVMEDALA